MCDKCSQVGNTDIAKWFNRKIKPHLIKAFSAMYCVSLLLKKILSTEIQTGTIKCCSGD